MANIVAKTLNERLFTQFSHNLIITKFLLETTDTVLVEENPRNLF